MYKAYTTHNSSICSDEGLTLETSAFQSLYGGQLTLSTPLIKQIFVFHSRTDAAPQFLQKLTPFTFYPSVMLNFFLCVVLFCVCVVLYGTFIEWQAIVLIYRERAQNVREVAKSYSVKTNKREKQKATSHKPIFLKRRKKRTLNYRRFKP